MKTKQPILSICIPTYNRARLLKWTTSLFEEQMKRNNEDVELIICDNCSSDDTESIILEYKEEHNFFQYKRYSQYVSGGESNLRSIENVRGKYFLLWSDDDIPAPMMVDILVMELKKYPDIECITFNRLRGYSNPGEQEIKKCTLLYDNYEDLECLYNDGREFIRDRWRGMTFQSADVISKNAWEKGQIMYPNNHLGWEYLAPILYGVSNGKCLFLNYPLCVQRWLYQPRYRVQWASYIYLGIPRMLESLQEKGVVDDWRVLYKDYMTNGQFSSSIFGYAFNMIYWATFDKPYYRPLIKEINHYQHSIINKMLTYGILTPDFILKPLKYMIKGVFTLMGKRNYV